MLLKANFKGCVFINIQHCDDRLRTPAIKCFQNAFKQLEWVEMIVIFKEFNRFQRVKMV